MNLSKYAVNVKIKRGLGFPFGKSEMVNVVTTVLQMIRGDEYTEVDCLITDNATIHKLNKRYRGIDRPTDVLSFSFSEKNTDYQHIGFPAEAESITPIGEIIISFPMAAEQSVRHGNTVKQELYLLLVHGTLHLLGYDHINNKDARSMRLMENKIIGFLDSTSEGNPGAAV